MPDEKGFFDLSDFVNDSDSNNGNKAIPDKNRELFSSSGAENADRNIYSNSKSGQKNYNETQRYITPPKKTPAHKNFADYDVKIPDKAVQPGIRPQKNPYNQPVNRNYAPNNQPVNRNYAPNIQSVNRNYAPNIQPIYNQKRQRAFTWKNALALILCIIMAVSGGTMVFVYGVVDSVNYMPIKDNNISNYQLTNPQGIINTDLSAGTLLNDPDIFNIMLFGEDNKQADEENGRSDAMLLISIDTRHKSLKVASLMRDMWLTIPGTNANGEPYGEEKLNAAYTLGGPELAVNAIETNFCIDIDRYAVVDFESFTSIIDALGGLDIELTDDEIGYINWQTYLNGQSQDRNEIKDKAGVVHLNGRQALWYARDRGFQDDDYPDVVFAGDDFDRTQRQRKMFETLIAKFKKANIFQITEIAARVGPMVTTNLKKDEIIYLMANSLNYLSYHVEQNRVPQDGMWQYGTSWDGQSYLGIIDLTACRTSLARFIYQDLGE